MGHVKEIGRIARRARRCRNVARRRTLWPSLPRDGPGSASRSGQAQGRFIVQRHAWRGLEKRMERLSIHREQVVDQRQLLLRERHVPAPPYIFEHAPDRHLP